ncbi:MAG: DegV family protein [Eggerthella lenta]
MNFGIVTDSSCNLVEDMIDEFGLHILPLTFMVDGEQYQSYLKGQHTDLKQFYTMMRDGKVITTSLPNLADSRRSCAGCWNRDATCCTWASPAGCRVPTRPSSSW